MNRFMLVRVSEESMSPTLIDGQWVLVLRDAPIRPGEIALFTAPNGGHLAIKRCVLENPERLEIHHGRLLTPWGNWYVTESQWEALMMQSRSAKDVLFMVGDNQFRSLDSRSYGFVPRENVLGRVLIRKNND